MKSATWDHIGILSYLTLTCALILAAFSHRVYDDPFITYRYAHNLAQGLGFVYNPGERILSTTTPLFTLLLVPFSYLHFDIPITANIIGALSIALGGFFLWDLAHTWQTPSAGWVAILLYATFPLVFSTLGSETPLYIALCLASFSMYARQKFILASFASALAVLTRPDGILVPLILSLDYLIRIRQKIPWKAVFLFLGLILPWFIFACLYFGSPLPATLATKQHQGAMAISQTFVQGFFTQLHYYSRRWFYWVELALACLGLVTMIWHKRRWLLFLSWSGLYFLSYTILGVSRYFWYYTPLLPTFVVLVGLGISMLASLLERKRELIPIKILQLKAIDYRKLTVLILVAPLFLAQISGLWGLMEQPDRRGLIYRDVGIWLNENTPPETLIGTLETGIIGYYAERPMLDFAGLIQPEVARQLGLKTTYEDAALWAVEHIRPNYLVLHSGIFPRLEQGFAAKYCNLIKQFQGEKYGYSQNLDIYTCN